MATTKRVRQRWAGACAVGLLCLSSVLMALVSDDSPAPIRIILVVLALGVAGSVITYLIRGRQKGFPLIFAPARWQVRLVSILGGVSVILIFWSLMENPRNLTSFAYIPAMFATWIGAMFRSEAAEETQRSVNDV